MAVSHLRNTPITGKSYTTSLDATRAGGRRTLTTGLPASSALRGGGSVAKSAQRTASPSLNRHDTSIGAVGSPSLSRRIRHHISFG